MRLKLRTGGYISNILVPVSPLLCFHILTTKRSTITQIRTRVSHPAIKCHIHIHFVLVKTGHLNFCVRMLHTHISLYQSAWVMCVCGIWTQKFKWPVFMAQLPSREIWSGRKTGRDGKQHFLLTSNLCEDVSIDDTHILSKDHKNPSSILYIRSA